MCDHSPTSLVPFLQAKAAFANVACDESIIIILYIYMYINI